MMLTPGTGHFYCGNCLRDNTLAHALMKQGHEVTMIPLYLPIHSESDQEPTTPPHTDEVFMGGINFYLQHKLPWLGKLPRGMKKWLDAPGLLRWSSRQGDMTDAHKHADLTLAMLRSEEEAAQQEIRRLMRWMKEHDPPDVISLCNVLLTGLARVIKSE
ncbi:MAG: glycosyltransferase family 1 protein, partial [Planctomycetota bacterium]|nr:glycosyltransferase family 1 protein [Planctomycetota bacterium]